MGNRSGYDGPDIGEKTLVSWAIMDDLDVQQGSILTIDRLSDPTFDAIVFGERQHHRWMAGSGWFHRTQDPEPGFEEKKTGELIMMAISYADDGGTARVRIYRNGDEIGDYTFGQFEPFDNNDAEAIWGKRHGGFSRWSRRSRCPYRGFTNLRLRSQSGRDQKITARHA